MIFKDIHHAGIDIIQTTNNYCLDRGINGLQNTICNIGLGKLDWIGTHQKQDVKKCLIFAASIAGRTSLKEKKTDGDVL